MGVDWNRKLSSRAAGLQGSITRKLMGAIEDPEMISLGGGLPAWDLFPIGEIRAILDDVLRTDGPAALQYGTSEGYRPLREAIAERCRGRGISIEPAEVLIDTGSMQGLDLLAKLFLDPGDVVVVEDPTFLTALQCFRFFGARFLTVPVDDEGMQVDRLPEILERKEVKLLYTMPTFQNPTGVTLSFSRRRALLEIAARFGVPIVEDDSYGELRYEGDALPTLKALDREGIVTYLASFSKTLSPGLRLGFLAAPKPIQEKVLFAKQAADLHSPLLSQRIAHEFLKRGLLDPHIGRLVAAYRSRRDSMLKALERHFPSGSRWSHPQGGFFLWASFSPGIDTTRLLEDAMRENVMFVPGATFFANGGGESSLRLNFSAYEEDKLEVGVERLARVVACGTARVR
jgi:DNA-binding transcriptional MocR family regulator